MLPGNRASSNRKLRSGGKRSLNGGARKGAGIRKKRPMPLAALAARKKQRLEQEKQKEEQQQIKQQILTLSNPKGKSLSPNTSTLLVRTMMHTQFQQEMKQTQMLHFVEKLTGISYATLYRLYRHYIVRGEVLVIDSSNRGGGSVKHIYHHTDLSTDIICSIHEFLSDQSDKGNSSTSKNVIDHVKDNFMINIPIRTMQSLLNRLGFQYGRTKNIGPMNDEGRKKRIRSFLYRYNIALNDKDTVLVYTDESYVNTNHSSNYTWFDPTSSQSNHVKKPSGRGKRLIILHAVTALGPLVTRTRKKQPIASSDNVDEKCLTAELIFEAVEEDGDYHKCMNGDIYMKWLRNRLIPTFKKLFPKKKWLSFWIMRRITMLEVKTGYVRVK